jgi:uncharacterized protein YjcR
MTENEMTWRQIRQAFLDGVSVRTLAEKYGVSRRTIEDRAKREGWSKVQEDAGGRRDRRTDAADEHDTTGPGAGGAAEAEDG